MQDTNVNSWSSSLEDRTVDNLFFMYSKIFKMLQLWKQCPFETPLSCAVNVISINLWAALKSNELPI